MVSACDFGFIINRIKYSDGGSTKFYSANYLELQIMDDKALFFDSKPINIYWIMINI